MLDTFPNTASPEDCQAGCERNEACRGFTWLSKESSMFPELCFLFSKTDEESSCDNCVSGPPECLCTVQGGCVNNGDNLVQAFADIASVGECMILCENRQNCTEYTYFQESHVMYSECFLFSSCPTLSEECTDCVTGMSHCQVCSFEDTQNGNCDDDTTSTTTTATTTTAATTTGPDHVICYECDYSDGDCTENMLGYTVQCDIDQGCYIDQYDNGDAYRRCGFHGSTPYCQHGFGYNGEYNVCYCFTSFCNYNLTTAGYTGSKDLG